MRNLIRENIIFFLGYLIVLMLALTLFGIYGKETTFLFVNDQHTSLGDTLFPYLTYFGDGITVVVFSFILLFFSYRKAILSIIIYLVSSQITQFFKRVVFNDFPRPSKYFESKMNLNFIDGVELHQMMSFPSGHSTSIFAFMAFLSIITKNKYISILYLLIACLGAYSRMYLAQHFLEDLIAGSIIGVLTAFTTTTLLNKYNWYHQIGIDAALFKRK